MILLGSDAIFNRMETKVRAIPTEDPFRKTWSQASLIISEEELAQVETRVDNSHQHKGNNPRSQTLLEDVNRNTPLTKEQTIEIVKRLNPTMPDIVIRGENGSLCQGQVQGQTQGQSQSHVTAQPEVFRTPQKTVSEFSQRLQTLQAEKHKHSVSVLGDKADWMLAERSNSRSPPSPAILTRSPDIRSRSPLVNHVSPSPSIHHVATPNVFNFSPERTELYQREQELESSRIKKRLFEEITRGHEVAVSRESSQPSYICPHPSPSSRHSDLIAQSRHLLSRDSLSRDELPPDVHYMVESTSSRSSPTGYHDMDRYRAKRRLDLDEDYVSTPKRLKSELEREMGVRYLNQLESDISSLSDRLYTAKPEVKSSSQCTCSIMEKQFLAMAESAYRSVRRIDASPRGFEQFRRELIQTNQVMKDSIDVLKNIRSFCEHKC